MIHLEPRFAKGWLRQGEAQAALGKAADAIASFEAGLLRAEGAARLALTRALQRAREVQAKAAQEASRRAAAARQQPSEASAASAAAGALEPSPPSPRRGGLTRRAPAHLLWHMQRVEALQHAALLVQLGQQHVEARAAAEIGADGQESLGAELAHK